MEMNCIQCHLCSGFCGDRHGAHASGGPELSQSYNRYYWISPNWKNKTKQNETDLPNTDWHLTFILIPWWCWGWAFSSANVLYFVCQLVWFFLYSQHLDRSILRLKLCNWVISNHFKWVGTEYFLLFYIYLFFIYIMNLISLCYLGTYVINF